MSRCSYSGSSCHLTTEVGGRSYEKGVVWCEQSNQSKGVHPALVSHQTYPLEGLGVDDGVLEPDEHGGGDAEPLEVVLDGHLP